MINRICITGYLADLTERLMEDYNRTAAEPINTLEEMIGVVLAKYTADLCQDKTEDYTEWIIGDMLSIVRKD